MGWVSIDSSLIARGGADQHGWRRLRENPGIVAAPVAPLLLAPTPTLNLFPCRHWAAGAQPEVTSPKTTHRLGDSP
jgi:hypothetical protein